MIKRRVIVALSYLVLIVFVFLFTKYINNSSGISEEAKNIIGYVSKIFLALGFVAFVYFIIKKS